MPKGNRRTFTKEFKLGVVYEMLSQRKNGDIFREYDVDRQTAHRWLQEFRSHGEAAFDSRNPCPGDEVAKLHRRLSPKEKSRLKIWSTDFTEQKIDGQRIFTSGIIDTRTKVLVGRLCADRIESRLTIDTLEQAIAKYGKPDMLLTDRGAQYMSRAFYDTLNGYGIAHSMSRPHKPVDNVYIETFWKTMKTEIGKVGHLCRPDYVMVVEYYVDYYNTERLHSSLSYKTPLRYMQEQNVI